MLLNLKTGEKLSEQQSTTDEKMHKDGLPAFVRVCSRPPRGTDAHPVDRSYPLLSGRGPTLRFCNSTPAFLKACAVSCRWLP